MSHSLPFEKPLCAVGGQGQALLRLAHEAGPTWLVT